MNTPFPAKTPKGQRRNKALISAASEIFIQHGFEGTTLDMIIERAGDRVLLYIKILAIKRDYLPPLSKQ
ncbi:TetR family transcriptional regulator [Providencia manganoxydans]